MLKQRLLSGSLVGFGTIAVFLIFPAHLLMLIFQVVCVLGLLEYFALLESAGIPHRRMTGTICGSLIMLANWVVFAAFSHEYAVAVEWTVLVLVFAVLFISQFARPYSSRPLTSLSSTLLGVMYIGFLAGFFPKLLLAWENGAGNLLLLYMIFIVKMGDIAAYLVGSRFGRRKLIPHVSPNKTWEGCIGGVMAGLVTSLVWYLITHGDLNCVRFSILDAIILGILLPIVGIFSDLTESFIKRAVGAKDSSKLVQGMGGVLDVTDSLLFSAPVLFLYAWIFMEKL